MPSESEVPPQPPHFNSNAPYSAWWVYGDLNGTDVHIGATQGATFLRALNAELRRYMGDQTWRVGNQDVRASMLPEDRWTRITSAALRALLEHETTQGDTGTSAAMADLWESAQSRTSRVTLPMLRAAIWATYHRTGVADFQALDAGRAPSISEVYVQGDTTPPPYNVAAVDDGDGRGLSSFWRVTGVGRGRDRATLASYSQGGGAAPARRGGGAGMAVVFALLGGLALYSSKGR